MRRYKRKDFKRDEFKESIENTIIFYEKHKVPVIWGIVGIIFVIIILFTYRSHSQNMAKKARENYNIGVVVLNSGEYQKAKQQFEMVRDQYWGTSFAYRSAFMLGNIYYKEGQIDKAIEYFEEFINGKYDELFTPSAYQGIAQCYEQKGNIVQALTYYEKALNEFTNETFKTDCLMQMGKLYLSMNRINEAENAYKEIIALTENPILTSRAKRKLEVIRAIREIGG